jgi:hypothetical protein
MAIAGGLLGFVLVAVLFSFRPASGSSFDDPGDPVASFDPPPFEPLGPEGLYAGYERLAPVTVAGDPAMLSMSRVDDLVLPSGRILASDAFYLDTPPFTVTLPAGTHPVFLLIVNGPATGSTSAAAMVRVDGGVPIRWEGAQTADAQPGAEPFVHGVDSGTSSFASAEAIALLRSLPNDAQTALMDQLLDKYRNGGDLAVAQSITVDPASGTNIVTFLSGYGDGGYASWFGFDASGQAVALLTSFDLIDDPSKPTRSFAPQGSGPPVSPAP